MAERKAYLEGQLALRAFGREYARRGYANEAAFRDALVAKARAYGWRCYYTHDSRHSPKGWPDVVFLHPSGRQVAR